MQYAYIFLLQYLHLTGKHDDEVKMPMKEHCSVELRQIAEKQTKEDQIATLYIM